MAMCNDNNNNNRDEKYEIQFIRFIKYYYVLSVISRGVVSLSGVGGTMNDLDSMRDFQLNYAVNNTYNSNNNNRNSHKLSLLCHLAFAVLAHFPFSVPCHKWHNQLLSVSSSNSNSCNQSSSSNNDRSWQTIIIICTLNTLKTSRELSPSQPRVIFGNCPTYLKNLLRSFCFRFFCFYSNFVYFLQVCRMHCIAAAAAAAATMNPSTIWQLYCLLIAFHLLRDFPRRFFTLELNLNQVV